MKGSRILIIEDDAALLRGLADNFISRGCLVETAKDGDTGLSKALSGNHDLVLLDIMVPTINGYEICRTMREKGVDSSIIMLTAKGQEDDVILGLNLGADDYVTKPFRIRELLARANSFLRRRKMSAAEAHSFGEFQMDLATHKLLRGSREVDLTAKEFRLLAYFLARLGRALTRDDILNAVWGNSVMVSSRSVDRCVTTLRGKIEKDSSHPRFIHTIRDIGYRFEDLAAEAG